MIRCPCPRGVQGCRAGMQQDGAARMIRYGWRPGTDAGGDRQARGEGVAIPRGSRTRRPDRSEAVPAGPGDVTARMTAFRRSADCHHDERTSPPDRSVKRSAGRLMADLDVRRLGRASVRDKLPGGHGWVRTSDPPLVSSGRDARLLARPCVDSRPRRHLSGVVRPGCCCHSCCQHRGC
jgi:hypothetical protein